MVNKKSNTLQKLKQTYGGYKNTKFTTKNFPQCDKDLNNYRNEQIAIQYCNDKMKSNLLKKDFCKDHNISINTLNNSLKNLGFNIKNRSRTKSYETASSPRTNGNYSELNRTKNVDMKTKNKDKGTKNKDKGTKNVDNDINENNSELNKAAGYDKDLDEYIKNYPNARPFDKHAYNLDED
ncbi:hypothetical protein CBEVV_011 [Choristoneura biennis entomopoxvirus 'L' virophage]|nr:hypothetical protein CBEVV_011 [Choristoneura biennis entomopoxvirus 'L' virophage]